MKQVGRQILLAGLGAEGLAIYPETIASAWLTQHHQDRARRLLGQKARRQKLYKQFINEASKLYADALVHDEAELSALVSVYALISRMRVVSSCGVIEKAEAVAHLIIDTYLTPNKTFPEFPRAYEWPSSQSAAGLQRGMPGRIAGAQ